MIVGEKLYKQSRGVTQTGILDLDILNCGAIWLWIQSQACWLALPVKWAKLKP